MHALKCLCEQQSTHTSDWQPASGSVRCWCLACNCCFHHPSLGVQHPSQAQAASQHAPNNKSQATINAHQMTRPAQPAEANKPRCHDPLQEEEIKQWHTACWAAVDAVLRLEVNSPPGNVLGRYRQVAPFKRGTSGLCTTEVPGQSHGQKPDHKAPSLCTHPQANKPHASKHQEKPCEPPRANDR